MIHVCRSGSLSDTNTLSVSAFGQTLERDKLDLSPLKALPNSTVITHYYFVDDEIFPLRNLRFTASICKKKLGNRTKSF